MRSLDVDARHAPAGMPRFRLSRLSALCALAAVATLVDFAAAAAYWSLHGVTPAQVLRSIASWVLGPRPPATPAVLAIGIGVHFLIYLAMAGVLSRLLASRHFPAAPGFAIGALYGVVAYVVVYQLLVPALVFPRALDRAPGWVAACLAVHALVIGPLLAHTLAMRRARSG